MARKIHDVPNGPAGDTRREFVQIETATMIHHPGKVMARVYRGKLLPEGRDAADSWKGPWDDERTAIRSLCMIYGIGGL